MIRHLARRRRSPLPGSRAQDPPPRINTKRQDDLIIICPYRLIAVALLLGFADASAVRTGLNGAAYAHEGHQGFAAGEPGDPQKPARTIKVVMREDGKKMAFEPALVTVRKGEQIRFVLENTGIDDHEFVLATVKENRKHAALMKKFPDMEHDDPNAKRLAPGAHGEILWKFTKGGTFEFACLIPGHREAGMLGKVVVK
jgi:uncharacterized cupredoxin-like copper-binding protein